MTQYSDEVDAKTKAVLQNVPPQQLAIMQAAMSLAGVGDYYHKLTDKTPSD